MQALLSAGADLEVSGGDGWTPLMWAARTNENPEVLQALLDAGADATAINDDGDSAWDLIQENEALKGTNVYQRLNELGAEYVKRHVPTDPAPIASLLISHALILAL